MPMSNELKALAEKLTKALSPEFDGGEIADIVAFANLIRHLRKQQHEIDELYRPATPEETETLTQ